VLYLLRLRNLLKLYTLQFRTMPYPSPDDRLDPNDGMPPMRARIPEHIAKGEISTGVIVVTGATEYVLDFVRNLPRPNAIVARVVLPHMVMPQFIEALAANIELFRQRYGDLPGAPPPVPIVQAPIPPSMGAAPNPSAAAQGAGSDLGFLQGSKGSEPSGLEGSSRPPAPNTGAEAGESMGQQSAAPAPASAGTSAGAQPPTAPPAATPNQPKRQNPQEVYDDLKLRDEILSGAYANAVMIGHGPYEFSFDFITNFYPQSAVSCRVFLASGHIYRLLESLRASWEQLKPRLTQPFPPSPPPPPRNLE
jgi:hypothetical protein